MNKDIEHIETIATQAYEAANPLFGELKTSWTQWDAVIADIEIPDNGGEKVNDLSNETCRKVYEWGTTEAAREAKKMERFVEFMNTAMARFSMPKY